MLAENSIPSWWNFRIGPRVDDLQQWLVDNRGSHWLFRFGFTAVAHLLYNLVQWCMNTLNFLTWPGVMLLATLIALRVSGIRSAVIAGGSIFAMGMLGLWDSSMNTIALMTVALVLTLALGIPLGIYMAHHVWFERSTKVIFDAMQVMPAYCYLIPTVLLFSIGFPPAVVATILFTLPATIRFVAHGIRGVPPQLVEVGDAHGATRRQILRHIEVPGARSTLMLAINQSINLGLGIVVIGALVGTGGTGQDVLKSVQTLKTGKGFNAEIGRAHV